MQLLWYGHQNHPNFCILVDFHIFVVSERRDFKFDTLLKYLQNG